MRELKTFETERWVKLAGPVANCNFYRPENYGEFKYYITSRLLSEEAPIDSDKTDAGIAVNMFESSNTFTIRGNTVLDIYIWAEKRTNNIKLAGVIVDI